MSDSKVLVPLTLDEMLRLKRYLEVREAAIRRKRSWRPSEQAMALAEFLPILRKLEEAIAHSKTSPERN